MVIRKRFRAILYPLTLYVCSGVASAYFVWTAVNGDRGLKTRVEYKTKIAALRGDLAALRDERKQWEHRIQLMRSEAIDGDLLDEEARAALGDVDARDLVVFSKAPSGP